MTATDVGEVADELYALRPTDFIAARDARVKAAKAAGDPDQAKAIGELRKPTVVAWLANQLARHRPDEVAPLVGLGAALREATADLRGPALRELAKQRHQLVQALVRQARALAADVGQRVPEDAARRLEETLHAALADHEVAARLVEGRLTDGVSRSGFSSDQPAPPATEPARARRRKAAGKAGRNSAVEDERRAEERARVEGELGAAWSAARRAADVREEADSTARTTADRRDTARREVQRLRAELGSAESDLASAEEAADTASAQQSEAAAAADTARQHVTELRASLDRL